MNIGSRVGAIASYKDGILHLFGYGIFEGEKVPDVKKPVGLMEALVENQVKNPCILLDNGDRVYGCECWWGPEEDIKKYEAEAKQVITLSVDAYRTQAVPNDN